MNAMLADATWTGNVQSVAFTVFGKDVAWYGIIITSAMLVGLFGAYIRCKKIGLTMDDLLEIFMIAIPLAVVCARLGYVFARPAQYLLVENFGWDDFVNIFAVWDGGLTIMTGVPGGILGGYIWCRWRKVDFLAGLDMIAPVVLLSQAIGRWGNFCNQEIYGAVITNANMQWFPMAVYIARDGAFHQALFFYEMVLNVLFFITIIVLSKRIKLKGFGILSYTGSYAFIRFVMEFFRDDGNIYDVINYTQLCCFIAAIACLAGIFILIYRSKKKGIRVWYKDKVPANELVMARVAVASTEETTPNNEQETIQLKDASKQEELEKAKERTFYKPKNKSKK
ncbi:MAG: prolipoprotein diacylglyceryl transferase [Bacillota bacterium]